MKNLSILSLLSISILILGFAPKDKNDAAEKLDWSVLANVEWAWDNNFYQVKFNDSQKALNGKEMIVEGFMFPLEYTRKHSNFLISPSPMSDCFFCGPGEAESMVYVRTVEPVDYNHRPVALQGTFLLVSDASMGIIYELKDARIVNR
jgi:hypothetical protein